MFRELRHALRLLSRNPAFAFVSIAAIALGIGVNTALFSIVNAVVLQPLPFAEPDRLVMVWETRPDRGAMSNVVSNANFLDWRARNQVFDAMSPVFFGSGALIGTGEPEQIRFQLVGEDFFPMLGVQMQLGRGFTAEECKPGGAAAAILSDTFWRGKFSADPGIVGRTIRLGPDAITVVGVAPAGMMTIGDRNPSLWRNARLAGAGPNGRRSSGRNISVLARLKPGTGVHQADRHMVELAAHLEREYPEFNSKWSARVSPLVEEVTGKAKTPLYFLLGAVACVLLIAITNVANLQLIRAAGRGRELAVRVALGASRGTLMRQMLMESMTLAVAGAAVGLPLGWWLLAFLKQVGPQDIKRLDAAAIDLRVLAFAIALTLFTGLLTGLVPAWNATRGMVGSAIRDGARGATTGARTNTVREAFTVAEIALSLILLVGAGLLLKSFSNLMAVDPGFRAGQLVTANISLPGNRYQDQQGVRFFEELRRRTRQLPGVVIASVITFLPFKGSGSATYYWRTDKPKPAPGHEPVTDVRMVQPDYFETMNIPLRQGRLFEDADNKAGAPLRFIVNETLAKTMFPGESAVGRHLIVQMKDEDVPGEIVGVTGDIKHGSLDATVRPMAYYPHAHLFFNFGTLVVQANGDPASYFRPVTALIHELDPELAVSEMGTMQRWIDESVARPRFQSRLLAGFAGLALVLAIIGIYSVVAYGVAQRRHEIGVRMALGARRSDVSRMVLGRGARLAMIGLAVGALGAFALGRYLETLLFEVKPADPVVLTAAAVGLLAVTLAASYLPARRAAGVEPLEALRYE